MTVLRSGSASDVGRVRAVNEDLALESLTLFAVADGMGGHAGGEVASSTAIDVLRREFTKQPSLPGLVGAVRRANRAVWERSHEDPDLRGMGTTLTAAALVATDEGDRLVLANVGDSRSYRFHEGNLVQLTRDHSVAEELVDRGELSEEEAAVHPHRHILTRALGVAPEVDVDVWLVAPEAGDRYLLCSDGLTNEVTTTGINDVLSATPEPQAAAEALVRLANEHGGSDNVTVVVLDVLVGDDHAPSAGAAVAGAGPGAVPVGGATTAAAGGAAAGSAAAGEGRAGTASPPVGDAPGRAGAAGSAERPATPQSLLGRFGESASMAGGGGRKASGDGLRSRRVTFRVLLFLIVLAALVAAGFYAVRWYVNSSYFVQTHRGEVVVYQGRPGGFLGIEPKVVWRTKVSAAKVPAVYLPRVNHGVEESSLIDACTYVQNIVDEQVREQQAAAAATTTTTAPPPPPGTPPPSTTTPAPTTTTTLALPKECRHG